MAAKKRTSTSAVKRALRRVGLVHNALPEPVKRRTQPILRSTYLALTRRATPQLRARIAVFLAAWLLLPAVLVVVGLVVGGGAGLGCILTGVAVFVALLFVPTERYLYAQEGPARAALAGMRGRGQYETVPTGHTWRKPAGWQPRITVVVTAFNDSQYLGAALRSVLAQDEQDFECIVVDDHSTDLTYDVAHEFAAVDARFRVVHHEGNAGLAAARNTGISYADAPWVTFLDADDFFYPQALSQRLAVVAEETSPIVIGSYCEWRSVGPDSAPQMHAPKPGRRRWDVTFLTAGYETPFIATAAIFRTDAVRALGGYDETRYTAEDFEFHLRVLRAGYVFRFAPYVGLAYRQVSGSMIRGNPALHVEVVRSIVDWLERPISRDELPGAVDPYLRSASTYQRELKVIRRQLNFLALAAGTGRDEQCDRVVAMMEHELLRRPLGWDVIEEGVDYARKRLGYPEGEADDVPEIRDMADRIRRALERGISEAFAEPHPPTPPAAFPLRRATVRAKNGHDARVVEVARKVRIEKDLTKAAGHVVLVPQSRYHLGELGPLALALQARGVPACFMVPPKSPPTVRLECAKYADWTIAWQPEIAGQVPVAAVVVLNDWGPGTTRTIVETANEAGVPSFGKVEGVQDFTDVDTGRQRRPYRSVRYVLGQGPNDVASLPGAEVLVVGNSRLERIALAPPYRPHVTDPLVINFNFTYNVLTEAADEWITSAQSGIEDGGGTFVVSLHPAQKESAAVRNVTAQPIRHELTRTGALVTRFSTVVYEAMARGVPVIYHNPHGEQVPDFQDPDGFFLKTESRDELAAAVKGLAEWQVDYRERSREFFARQVDVDPSRPAEQRAADVIVERLTNRE